jgi:acyl-CoA thioesterase-1
LPYDWRVRRVVWLTIVAAAVTAVVAAYLGNRAGGQPPDLISTNPAPGASARLVWPKGRPLRVLFVGDSLTVGYYASRRNTAFPAIVTSRLRARGRVVETVSARRGATASYWAIRSLPAADLVVLELGTNDYGGPLTPPATFDRDYSRLVANVRVRSPNAALLCVSVWRTSHFNYGGEALPTYNKIIAQRCRGGAFVWISQLYNAARARAPAGAPTYLGASDGFHPNDVGHRAIAKAIEETLGLR